MSIKFPTPNKLTSAVQAWLAPATTTEMFRCGAKHERVENLQLILGICNLPDDSCVIDMMLMPVLQLVEIIVSELRSSSCSFMHPVVLFASK